MTKLIGIVGSLREASINRQMLRALQSLTPEGVTLEEYSLADVPLYNADLGEPTAVAALKAAITTADGVLFVTPEYNYGIPGVLKNAIDWASRPAYASVLAHKPVAMLGAAPGVVGTVRAQGQLKQVLLGTVSHVFPYPEVAVGLFASKFDQSGTLTDVPTRDHLAKFLRAFAEWVALQPSR